MKQLYKWFFLVLVKIAYALYRIEGVNACLLIAPAKLIPQILRSYGATVGRDIQIHSPLIIHNARENYAHLTIGDECYIGRAVFLDLTEVITLEDRVTLSMRVSLLTHLDVGRAKVKAFLPNFKAPIQIQSDSYLGAGVLVAAGVHIGACSAVGAGSVVLESIGNQELHGGAPAKKIRDFH